MEVILIILFIFIIMLMQFSTSHYIYQKNIDKFSGKEIDVLLLLSMMPIIGLFVIPVIFVKSYY